MLIGMERSPVMVSNLSAHGTGMAQYGAMDEGFRRNRMILGGVAAIFGGMSIFMNAGDALAGDTPSICRTALGAVGVLAAMLLQVRPELGYRLGWLWALAQIPVYAWVEGGNPTAQWLDIPLGFTSKTTFNGSVVDYSLIGVNVVGIILFAIFHRLRVRAS
jgi:hypothetical protein